MFGRTTFEAKEQPTEEKSEKKETKKSPWRWVLSAALIFVGMLTMNFIKQTPTLTEHKEIEIQKMQQRLYAERYPAAIQSCEAQLRDATQEEAEGTIDNLLVNEAQAAMVVDQVILSSEVPITTYDPTRWYRCAGNECTDKQHVIWNSEAYERYTKGTEIPWQIVSAIHLKENGRQYYSCDRGTSGEVGPFQFMPGTWKAYRKDGNEDGHLDRCSFEDGLASAINYIEANMNVGKDLYHAVWQYNGAKSYANAIFKEARVMGATI